MSSITPRRTRIGQSAYNAAYYAANRDRIRAQQAAYRTKNRQKITASRKGLSLSDVEGMLAQQGGLCAICSMLLESPHIDHDHDCCPGSVACGSCVRGLLCAACNHMLGKSGDSPEILEAGAAYLRLYKRTVV